MCGPGAFYNLNALKFYLSCEPVDADLVHEVVKPFGGLELELAEHVGGEGALLAQAGGGGETQTEGEQEPGDHGDCEVWSGPGSLSNCVLHVHGEQVKT